MKTLTLLEPENYEDCNKIEPCQKCVYWHSSTCPDFEECEVKS